MKKALVISVFSVVILSIFCTIIYIISKHDKFQKYYNEIEEFYANNDLFSYTDVSPGKYTFDDLYSPGKDVYDYDDSGTITSPDSHHSELYLNNENYDMLELTQGESKIILEYLKNSKYMPLSRKEAYKVGLLKDSEDGKFRNISVVEPDIMFYYYSLYPQSIMGEYYSIVIDVIRYKNEVYLVLMEQNPISDIPRTSHLCIFKSDSPKQICDLIDLIFLIYETNSI